MPAKITATKINLAIGVRIAVTVAAVSALVFAVYFLAGLNVKKIITVGGAKVSVDVARTESEMAKGLSGRERPGENEGLLFAYDGYFVPSFWMKDMSFSLDIIWIKDDMIVGLEKNVPVPAADDELTRYAPANFVNYVLEVNAGFSDKHNLKIGDKVEF